MNMLPPISLAVLALLAFLPMLVVFFQQQWAIQYYQHFPFIILAALWFVWSRSQEATRLDSDAEPKKTWLPGVLVGISCFGLFAAICFYNPWLSSFSFLLLLTALFLGIKRQWKIPHLWRSWAVMWLILPLPLGLGDKLVQSLQRLSSRLSSNILDLMRVDHLMDGNILRLPSKDLFVDEACSGVVSVMSGIACAVIWTVWKRRTIWQILSLVACSILWAALFNVVRIVSIALAESWFSINLAEGWQHDVLGLGIFLFTFLALISTDSLLDFLFGEIALRGEDDSWMIQTWNWAFTEKLSDEMESTGQMKPVDFLPRVSNGLFYLLALIFGGLILGQGVLYAYNRDTAFAGSKTMANAKSVDLNSFPSELKGWKRIDVTEERRDRDSIFGEYSRTAIYESEDGRQLTLSFDFPFSQGWHELTVCYSGAGWEMNSRDIKQSDEWNIISVDMDKPGDQYGHLQFCMFTEFGDPVSPPTSGGVVDMLWRRLKRRNRFANTAKLFQVQVFTVNNKPVPETTKQVANEILKEARQWLRDQTCKIVD